MRNHPGINYYRSGIPVVLAGDDPGSFGYDELTMEYYLSYMAWGLNLSDLKKIATNSITYSIVSENIRKIGYQKFSIEWNSFIDNIYNTACKAPFKSPYNVSDLIPNFGPSDRVNKVSIFGYGFENFICQPLISSFGGIETLCKIKSLNEISCDTPVNRAINQTVTLQLKYGSNILATNLTYTFLSVKRN